MVEKMDVQVFNPFRPMYVTIKENSFGIMIANESGIGFAMKVDQAKEFIARLAEFVNKYEEEMRSI